MNRSLDEGPVELVGVTAHEHIELSRQPFPKRKDAVIQKNKLQRHGDAIVYHIVP